MSDPEPVLIGDNDDPHIARIKHSIEQRGRRPLILDLESVMDSGLSVGTTSQQLKIDGVWHDFSHPRSGWLRRLHRADWGFGVEAGSLSALELGTWHSTFSWFLETATIQWVTEPFNLRQAESKLRQWRISTILGVPYPKTLITTSDSTVEKTFSTNIVVKPIGTGQFQQNGSTHTVYAESMMPTDSRLKALKSAPFIIQEHIPAKKHLRIVTVADRSWVASLSADQTPYTDWRRNSHSHFAFVESPTEYSAIAGDAVRIANGLNLGFSSQDWIVSPQEEAYLLDVNPAGQWLFLPNTIGTAVCEALTDLLLEEI